MTNKEYLINHFDELINYVETNWDYVEKLINALIEQQKEEFDKMMRGA